MALPISRNTLASQPLLNQKKERLNLSLDPSVSSLIRLCVAHQLMTAGGHESIRPSAFIEQLVTDYAQRNGIVQNAQSYNASLGHR